MKKVLTILLLINSFATSAQQISGYHLLKTFKPSGNGGWDYLAINKDRLYVSHGTQVNVLNKITGDSIGAISNTIGVHGIAFCNSLGKGYSSNGRLNNVFVIDLNTNTVIDSIATGKNPDAILYDDYSKKIITCNGRSNDLTVIDAATQKVVATIAIGGKPETLVSNNTGKWMVNIEDKNEIVVVNATSYAIENRWSLLPGLSPTGLAIDTATNLLFAGCEKLLIVMDANTGKIKQQLPIGDGCDGVAFDRKNKLVFTANGEGNMTIIKEEKNGNCQVVETITTKKRARTIAIDEAIGWVYLPTASFEPLPPGATEKTRPKIIEGSFQVLVLGK